MRRSLIAIAAISLTLATACSKPSAGEVEKERPAALGGAAQETQASAESKGHSDPEGELGEGQAADDTLVSLVNKKHPLDKAYVPEDLVPVDVPTVLDNPEVNQLRKEAAAALSKMFDAASEDGVKLYARSGYRSYKTQEALFASYSAREGEEAANRYSARAGQSEHQTGLAMDVTSESVSFQLDEAFGETTEGRWLAEHAHEYGFIIRYPQGKEDITGYIYEPWHVRFLGVRLAASVYESGLTYEEFVGEGIE
ncbi:D-alanyl-D-alanine carboxypeptidase family protein [Cohnella sp. AR92]|nr:D-alanyl-D-alanine carboxypeptidase family protein [Cohnella sp. AR92]